MPPGPVSVSRRTSGRAQQRPHLGDLDGAANKGGGRPGGARPPGRSVAVPMRLLYHRSGVGRRGGRAKRRPPSLPHRRGIGPGERRAFRSGGGGSV